MGRVFVSYAHGDRSCVADLVNDLKGAGYEVWWDAHLDASEDFEEGIRAALDRAEAAIVVWSPVSVKSSFVRDEARYALEQGKLVSTKLSELPHRALPFGFGSQHTVDVGQRDEIVRALDKLGVQRAVNVAVRDTGRPDLPMPIVSERSRPRSVLAGPLLALLRGLTLQFPIFQTERETKWHAIGLSLIQSLMAVVFLNSLPVLNNIPRFKGALLSVELVAVLGCFTWYSWYLFIRVSRSRTLVASVISGVTSMFATIFFVALTLVVAGDVGFAVDGQKLFPALIVGTFIGSVVLILGRLLSRR